MPARSRRAPAPPARLQVRSGRAGLGRAGLGAGGGAGRGRFGAGARARLSHGRLGPAAKLGGTPRPRPAHLPSGALPRALRAGQGSSFSGPGARPDPRATPR